MTDTDIIKDANRYRWLRDRSENVIIDLVSLRTWENVEGYKAQLDNLIDNELASASAECLQMAEVMPEQEPAKDWVVSHNEICVLLRQAHDALALTSYPPKRKWVGLTDDEVDDIGCDFATLGGDIDAKDWFAFYLAIEAKLKEKNT